MPKTNSAKLPALGASFLKPGDCVVNFYYSLAEQCRFAGFLQEAISKQYSVILASTSERHPILQSGLSGGLLSRRLKHVSELRVTPDLKGSVSRLEEAAREAVKRTGEARVLVDFAGIVSHEGIFEVEAALHAAVEGMRLITISQYDGNAFPAGITLEQFQTHALTVVGNVFYSENRKFIKPEAYLRTRIARARSAVRAAGIGR